MLQKLKDIFGRKKDIETRREQASGEHNSGEQSFGTLNNKVQKAENRAFGEQMPGKLSAGEPGSEVQTSGVQTDGAMPNHVAIIMDGNGRWAQKKALPRTVGHKEGAETLKRITRYCKNIGIRYLTVYAFSTENWKRPQDEVSGILRLLRHYIDTFDSDPENNRIRMRFIGDIEALDEELQNSFRQISERTKDNEDAITLTIAFNYGGRNEIVKAAQKAVLHVKSGELEPEQLTEDRFAGFMSSAGIPYPDLLIRPGGEIRISNFLLWELAYSELWFTDVLWPDFGDIDIDNAVIAYQKRQRRYGGI